ncbi:hypothetical protein V5799_026552 [Amblyomma americanum]|uniref:Tnf receptor-associated factor n=1 Tax=Amblyomma americanum TaxID=6943 RepID=A0AAQ4DI92_AMBAM
MYASRKRFVTGFPYIANWTLVEFRREPPLDRVCSLCGVLAAETLWAPCKHVFCRRCFQGLATGEPLCCPVDGVDFSAQQMRLDRSAPELFRQYPVGCKNKGCFHVPTLATYEKHIALCEYQLVLCELCSRRVQVSQVLSHVRNECRRVSAKAEAAKSAYSAPDGAVGGDCAQRPDARVETPLADRCDVVSQELKTLRMTIHDELRSFRTALEEAKASLAEDQRLWKQSTVNAGDETAQLLLLEGETLSRELGAVEEDSPPSSCYVWKVADFARMRQDALEGRTTSFSSDAFYCGGAGYRMYLQGSLGNSTTAGGPCLGLYFVLTAGSFDTSLSWPYAQKTSFVLISTGGTYNIQGDIRPESEGEEWGHCFRKPRPGEDNEGFGFSQFITLDDLANPDYGYIRDNSFTVHFLTELKA